MEHENKYMTVALISLKMAGVGWKTIVLGLLLRLTVGNQEEVFSIPIEINEVLQRLSWKRSDSMVLKAQEFARSHGILDGSETCNSNCVVGSLVNSMEQIQPLNTYYIQVLTDSGNKKLSWQGTDGLALQYAAMLFIEENNLTLPNCNKECLIQKITDTMQQRLVDILSEKNVVEMKDAYTTSLQIDESENVALNRKIWDRYATIWGDHGQPLPWVVESSSQKKVELVGDEWGDVDRIVVEWIKPFVTSQSVVAEIGPGGGRVAIRVAKLVNHLQLYDISAQMLRSCQRALSGYQNVGYTLLDTSDSFESSLVETLDYVYCFDVLVHADMHTQWRYFNAMFKLLRPGGYMFVSLANLFSEEGFNRFKNQKSTDIPFHFVTEEIASEFITRSGFRILKINVNYFNQGPSENNVYYDRDILILAQKPVE